MWVPKSEADIEAAISSGDMRENAYLDVKRAVGDTPGSRAETAKDLASFALFGGAVLIGVDEDKQAGTFSLAPQPLANVPEKIEQIAANRIDPPLFVRVITIPSEPDPDLGYLFVEVPPSATAPHMVDGRYYARADRTTRRLTDAEVLLHHQRREGAESRVLTLLHDEIARDPWRGRTGPDEREHAHMFLVAEPLRGPREMLVDVVRSGNNSATFDLLIGAERDLDERVSNFAPTPRFVAWWVPRAKGFAASTFANGVRQPGSENPETDSLDIEVQEDGGIRVFCGRLSDYWGKYSNQPQTKVLLDGLALAYAFRLVRWAESVASFSGYRGPWGFGFAGTSLAGLASHTSVEAFGERSYPYDRDVYEGVTTASLQEIQDAPGAVVNRFVGQFLRGVGTATRYSDLLA